ncbi:MAG TPA: hypothetical protein PK760_08770 [Flavobacteriales bacterium]|nr:hypothetical protein [Flavobacteriales bacterium]
MKHINKKVERIFIMTKDLMVANVFAHAHNPKSLDLAGRHTIPITGDGEHRTFFFGHPAKGWRAQVLDQTLSGRTGIVVGSSAPSPNNDILDNDR